MKRFKEKIFDMVLETNQDYIDAINRGASADEQEELLKACRLIMDFVVSNGWQNDYSAYVDIKRFREGR